MSDKCFKVECVICLKFIEDDETSKVLPCGGKVDHIFHFRCVMPWIGRYNTCPICRSVVHKNKVAPASASAIINRRPMGGFRFVSDAFPDRSRLQPRVGSNPFHNRQALLNAMGRAANQFPRH
mmetsp:Transcript_23802/g.32745  ORF Transcript_23802/g.32745 Transcript_23802/m.32745 type:complete len:123 (+) Transcript_23802:77-445(+)